jgi:hypothetical protein
MQSYLVEAYVPRRDEDACRAAVRRAQAIAEQLSRDGTSVRYVRSLFVAEDETCFHVFEGASAEAVAEVSRKADLTYARIVRVTLDAQGNVKEKRGKAR